jgi:hypothetical protein
MDEADNPGSRHSAPTTLYKQISCQTPSRRINIGWVSFQEDGSISFGLNDRTYISPKFRARIGVWSAYNRVGIRYAIPSDQAALEPVQNPHFSFHPPGQFHLKEHNAKPDDVLFHGIALVDLTVRQQSRMPWLRAVSAPFSSLRPQRFRSGRAATDEMVMHVPDERLSAWIDLDFVSPETAPRIGNQSTCCVVWRDVALRISLGFTGPRIATLSWFHSC